MKPQTRRSVEALVVAAAIGLAFFGLVVAAVVVPSIGDYRDDRVGGSRITWLEPGTPMWRAGIRSGQTITTIEQGEAGELVRLVTDGDVHPRAVFPARLLEDMRLWIAPAAIGLVGALIGAALTYRRFRVGVPLSAAGAVVAAQPLLMSGFRGLVWSGILGIGFVVAGAALIGRRPRPRARITLGAVVMAATLAWFVALLFVPAWFDAADLVRAVATAVVVAISIVVAIDRRSVVGWLQAQPPPRLADLAPVGLAIAAAAALVVAVGVDPVIVTVLLVGAALIYPAGRRLFLAGADRIVMADVRAQASLEAVEQERARLARDLHDSPLQELAGVIRRLDALPEAGAEAIILRDVAQQLRDLAIRLRPPVLEDLGLGAALLSMPEIYGGSGGPRIDVAIDDLTDHRPTTRPPPDVELAVYRIVAEAVLNSVGHSGADVVEIRGLVSPAEVHVRVADDGRGLDPVAVTTARRRGHFGLDTMRQRAAAIDATISVDPGPERGTVVAVRWP